MHRHRPAPEPVCFPAADGVELRTEALGRSFGARVVLHDVDLEVRAGERVAIVGLSGSGKTVLLHCLTGLLPLTAGRALAADHSVAGAPLTEIAGLSSREMDRIRLAWSFVFQKNALFSGTVYENCALWLREHTRLDEGEIEERVRRALEGVGLDVADVLPKESRELSGGMAKRVAVARAVASQPVVLFYDEPTTGLDPVNAARVHDLVWTMHHSPRADAVPRTTVLVTHDRELLRRVHPRVVMLHEGGVCFDGPYETFSASEVEAVRDYMSSMPALHARPAG